MNNQIFILGPNNEQLGPFTSGEVRQGLANQNYRGDQLAFTEGLSQWTPLIDVLAHIEKSAPVSYAAPAMTAPASTLQTSNTLQSSTIQGLYVKPGEAGAGGFVYATFSQRFGARFIDFVILFVFNFIVGIILQIIGATLKMTPQEVTQISYIPLFILEACYFAGLESSEMQATLGKKALGLKVTDEYGNRIGFPQALGRWAGKIISGLICLAGYFRMIGDPRGQTLHDTMAKTLVLVG